MEVKLKKSLLIGFFLSVVASVINAASVPCELKETKYGAVCVCNATYCDYLEDPTPENDHEFVIISSTKAGLRFHTTEGRFNVFRKYYVFDRESAQEEQPVNKVNGDGVAEQSLEQNEIPEEHATNSRHVHLNIDREKQYQNIIGFGGSFTGAVSYILDLLPQELQDHIYESYYSATRGIGFNLMRIPIGCSDFDLEPWAYNETPENDTELSNFNALDQRDLKKVEQIKRLKEISQVANLRIKGAAWSPPRWMKTNNKWTGYSRLKEEFYQTWADYHVKWLELMEDNGLPIWAISTGNEPLNGVFFMFFVKFVSLGWTPKKQAKWLGDNLGPSIRNSKFKDLVIFGNDDQRFDFPIWFQIMNSSHPGSIDYLDGLAMHWYWDEIFQPVFIEKAHALMPDKIILSSESCIGDKPWQKATPVMGSWKRGEKYARAFLQNLQHHFNGWIDWNIILDEQGGPNYVNNTVDAPIIANLTTFDEVYKQPMFYAMGHFSKFIPEGSIRIDSERSNVNIDTVAFLKPDGGISAVLLNTGNANVEVSIEDTIRGNFIVNLPARSFNTIIYK